MKYLVSITVLSASWAVMPAAAQSVADGVYTDGFVELEYFDNSGSDQTLGYADVDFGIAQSDGGLGIDLGIEALSSGGNQQSAVYGALSYSGGFGKVSLGVPRPALEGYVSVPSFGGATLIDVMSFSVFDGSVVSQAYLSGSVDAPIGLRYDGTFGSAKLGVSVHDVEGSEVYDFGMNYDLGVAMLRGGLEHVAGGGSDATNYMIGAEGEIGPVQAGILYSNIDFPSDANALQLYATYKPLEQLAMTANVMSIDGGGPTGTLYGLSANYSFYQGAYVEAGLVDGNSGSSAYNLSLGFKF